jgi:hypothetical protein
MPPSFSTTPIRNSGLGYITSTIHQSPFGLMGAPTTAPIFTPSLYILLQAITSIYLYTPWRSTIPLGELRSLTQGQTPFFKGVQGNVFNFGL